MTIVWPLSLPQAPLAGCALQLPWPVLRQQPEIGPAIQRRRRAVDGAVWQVEYEMERGQALTFAAFVEDGLRGGEQPFDWVDPLAQAVVAASLRDPPQLRQTGPLLWRTALTLEIAAEAPPDAPDAPAAWPEALPADILRGHARTLPGTVLRSPPELGPQQRRRRGRAAAVALDRVELMLTQAQAQTLRAWWREGLLFGTRRFAWRDPLSRGPGWLRFRGAARLRHLAGAHWSAELPLELLPGGEDA